MIYSNKKISSPANLAQQTAQIIDRIKKLTEKNLIRLTEDTIYVDRQLWINQKIALNWIDCLAIYYKVKMQYKNGLLSFKDIHNLELIGTYNHKKAKVLIDLG